jgi:hypothetical protein
VCRESYHCTLDMCTKNKVRKYNCECEMVDSMYATLETHQQIFFMYKYDFRDLTDNLKYGEHQLKNIWRWVCRAVLYVHNGYKTHEIEKREKPKIL